MTKSTEDMAVASEAVRQLVESGLEGAFARIQDDNSKLRGLSLLVLEVLAPDDQRTAEARAALPATVYRVKA